MTHRVRELGIGLAVAGLFGWLIGCTEDECGINDLGGAGGATGDHSVADEDPGGGGAGQPGEGGAPGDPGEPQPGIQSDLAGDWHFIGYDQERVPREQDLRVVGDDPYQITDWPNVTGTVSTSAGIVTIRGTDHGLPYTMTGSVHPDGLLVSGTWGYDDGANSGTFELHRMAYDLSGTWFFEGVDQGNVPRNLEVDLAGEGNRYTLSYRGAPDVTGSLSVEGNQVVIAGSDFGLGYRMDGTIDPTAQRISGSWVYDDGSNRGTFDLSRF